MAVQSKRYTVEEFDHFVDLPENADKLFEYIGGGYMVSGERYAPDVAYIAKSRQEKLAERGYNPLPPDLAVEVLSPSSRSNSLPGSPSKLVLQW